MMNNNDNKVTTKVGPQLSEILVDIKDAYDSVCRTDEAVNYFSSTQGESLEPEESLELEEYVDQVEVRELIWRASYAAISLYHNVCKYAAYARAYAEALSSCGIDINKILDQNRVETIRESLKKAAMGMPASAATNQ